MKTNFELQVQALMDGELNASDARAVERELAQDISAAQCAANLRALKDLMAGQEMATALPESREFYWSKIQREIERTPVVARPARAGWRSWLAPVAGLASLACMVALAMRPFAPPSFDEISANGEGMEAMTFHDQAAGMTVVWLADATTPETKPTPAEATPENPAGQPEVDMD